MSKFHINKHGVPAPCRAKPGNCPLGGEENHFKTEEEAQAHADKINSAKYGTLPYGTMPDVETQEEAHAIADAQMQAEYGEPEERVVDRRFQYTPERLERMEGLFVEVEYDGKKFDGEIIGTHYNNENDNGLIIQNENGDVKHIKNYRLTDVEYTGSSLPEHRSRHEFNRLDSEVIKEGPEYVTEDYSIPETSDTEMYEQVDKYVDAVIDKHNGKDIDLGKVSLELGEQWTEDVEDNHEAYLTPSEGGQYETWDSSSEDAQQEDLERAEQAEAHFHQKVELVDVTYEKVKNVDWEQYGMTQKEGVTSTMNALKDAFNEVGE